MRGLLATLLLLLAAATATRAETPPGCEVFWVLTPDWRDSDMRLQVRTVTPAGEAGARDWRPSADDPSLMAGAHHFVALGQALLPLPPALASRPHLQMCLRADGLDNTQVLASNLHPEPAGADRLLRWQGSPALLRELVLAAGSLQLHERTAGGLRLRLLVAPGLVARGEALADDAAATLAAQRRFWHSSETAQALLLLHADDRGAAPATLARTQALVLRAPSAALAPGMALRMQLIRADLRGRFRDRFGPTVYEHQPDDAASAWFVEGLSLFYTLRLAAADGWPLEEFAGALTALWQQDTAVATAPWLPLKWHTALRERGSDGLDSVLRRLAVPAAQARAAGRLSSPQAGHRLFAALRPELGDEPRRDVQQAAQRLSAGPLPPDAFGPCFTLLPAERRVQAAAPSAACRGWLAGTPPASASTAADSARPSAAAKRSARSARTPRSDTARRAPATRATGKSAPPRKPPRRAGSKG